MTPAMVRALKYPEGLVDAPIIRTLISRQCEIMRSLQIRPEFASLLHTTTAEIEQTIAAHQLALLYLKART